MSFGAHADGVQDDTAAFRSALNAVHKAGGGTLNIPAGSYRLKLQADGSNPTIVVYNDTTIQADSNSIFLSEVGPGGSWGFNTCLFVNADPFAGNHNISFLGGQFRVAAPAARGLTGTSYAPDSSGQTNQIQLSNIDGLEKGMGIVWSGIGGTIPTISAINATNNVVTLSAKILVPGGPTNMLAGWSGGPFLCMINVSNFQLGGGIALQDTDGGGLLDTAWMGFRALLLVNDFNISNVQFGYVNKHSKIASDYGMEDGLHFMSGTKNGTISNLSGTTGDDFIAFDIESSITGYPLSNLTIENMNISNIEITNITATSQWAQALRLLVGPGSNGVISNINVQSFSGTADALGMNTGSAGILMTDLTTSSSSKIQNISMQNVALNCTSIAGPSCIWLNKTDSVQFSNFNFKLGTQSQIAIQSSANVTLNGQSVQ